ncbi:MFS transporter [Erythrobacter insulae]|uniref:MFS transporter n=1 Tax=Erythrobacter insulae TaxID=2584124 RepID=A0A547P7E5_9SPHN|nr:MFS transporter [Erythrobacter insulae]TRD10061.1 MFS transporter [Erythrobacter insulae]
MADQRTTLDAVFEAIVIDDEGRACRDIPDSACREEPRNFLTHVTSLSLSKVADGLIDPKLVLSWLMTSVGAPSFLIGLLVPVREAGALLPQMFTAGAIRRMPHRKYAWALGAVFQGLGAFGIFAAALFLEGAQAGWAILASLTILALARSVCSVSYKDVLGKTVSKSRRGTATGLAGSIAAALVIVFAVMLVTDFVERQSIVLAGLVIAGICWIAGGLLFTSLQEHEGATDGGQSAFVVARQNLSLLSQDRQLRLFIFARGCLTATALAPPFMIAAASGAGQSAFEGLGFLVLASSGAALVSSAIWGRLADRSSRRVLLISALAGGAALAVSAAASYAGLIQTIWVLPLLLLGLMISYQGVRLGRSTHLVDMATEDTRAAYTALSNTIIGAILLGGSVFGAIAQFFGNSAVLALMAALCLAGAYFAARLEEVQEK